MNTLTKLFAFVAFVVTSSLGHASDTNHTYACTAARQGNVPITIGIDSILNTSKPNETFAGLEIKPYETTVAIYKQGVLQKRSKVLESTGFPALLDPYADFKFDAADESLHFPTHELISADVPKSWGKKKYEEHKKAKFDISLNGMTYHCKFKSDGKPSAELVATVNPSAVSAPAVSGAPPNGSSSSTAPIVHDDSHFMGPGSASN